MSRIQLYILILVSPAIIFSIRIILIEVANLLSVSDYAKQLSWLKQLIGKITGSYVKESEINEELVNILQMLSIMISAGESPMMALRYISQRSVGYIPTLINQSFSKYESGNNLTQTLEYIAAATGSSTCQSPVGPALAGLARVRQRSSASVVCCKPILGVSGLHAVSSRAL